MPDRLSIVFYIYCLQLQTHNDAYLTLAHISLAATQFQKDLEALQRTLSPKFIAAVQAKPLIKMPMIYHLWKSRIGRLLVLDYCVEHQALVGDFSRYCDVLVPIMAWWQCFDLSSNTWLTRQKIFTLTSDIALDHLMSLAEKWLSQAAGSVLNVQSAWHQHGADKLSLWISQLVETIEREAQAIKLAEYQQKETAALVDQYAQMVVTTAIREAIPIVLKKVNATSSVHALERSGHFMPVTMIQNEAASETMFSAARPPLRQSVVDRFMQAVDASFQRQLRNKKGVVFDVASIARQGIDHTWLIEKLTQCLVSYKPQYNWLCSLFRSEPHQTQILSCGNDYKLLLPAEFCSIVSLINALHDDYSKPLLDNLLFAIALMDVSAIKTINAKCLFAGCMGLVKCYLLFHAITGAQCENLSKVLGNFFCVMQRNQKIASLEACANIFSYVYRCKLGVEKGVSMYGVISEQLDLIHENTDLIAVSQLV